MSIKSFDDMVKRVSDGQGLLEPLYGYKAASSVTFGSNLLVPERLAFTKVMPSLAGDNTGYIPTRLSAYSSITSLSFIFGKLVNLGSLDISTPTFTDGNAMPSVTELGASVQTASPILIEVTTALNATPGSITATYVDQDGNTSETTASQSLPASAELGAGGWLALNSPDTGAQDITTATRSGGTTPTGVIKFWGMLPLCLIQISPGAFASTINFLTEAFNWMKLGAGDTLGGFVLQNSAAKTVVGEVFYIADN